jgi:FlaA1/EpsC-like NDP-sugar epimerase
MAQFSQNLVPDIEKMAQEIDPNQYTYPFQLTKIMHREPYDELLPSKASNSQKRKIVIITGAYGGIGAVCIPCNYSKILKSNSLLRAQPQSRLELALP